MEATEFLTEANELGFNVYVRNTQEHFGKAHPQSWIVEVATQFAIGNSNAFAQADSLGHMLLSGVPKAYPGTTWGTDGASVGGASAISSGNYHLQTSGVSARFAKALRKALS